MYYNIFLIVLAVVLQTLATIKILKWENVERKRKIILITLTWFIIIIWAIFILIYSNQPPKKDKNFERHRYMEAGYSMYRPHRV